MDIDVDTDTDCSKDTCEANKCSCTLEYDPICCNGIEYSNPCHAECNGIDEPAQIQYDKCFMGKCSDQHICTTEYNPICCDDIEYSNPCLAKESGITHPWQCYHGKCGEKPDDYICTREYKPYCCDDTTYSNECVAQYFGYDTEDESVCSRGSCESGCICPYIYEPVCCSLKPDNCDKDDNGD